MLAGPLELIGWTALDSDRLEELISRYKEEEENMRKNYPLIDATLWKWEYRNTFIDKKWDIWFAKFKRDNLGLVGTNRGDIVNYIPEGHRNLPPE